MWSKVVYILSMGGEWKMGISFLRVLEYNGVVG